MVRTTGSKSFTAAETAILLDIVEKIRPLHRNKWEEVAVAYNDHIAGKDMCARDADALKRRFMVLAYAKKPSEEWRDSMDRAMAIHHSILEENGASVINLEQMGGLVRAGDNDEMLLLNEGEAELVHTANSTPLQGFEEEYLGGRYSGTTITLTPVRTGKRGRPPGSTTGAAAKRFAQQHQQVQQLTRTVAELQLQLREVREALATVVETQTNQSAVLAVLQQQLHQQDSSMMVMTESKYHHGLVGGQMSSEAQDIDDEDEEEDEEDEEEEEEERPRAQHLEFQNAQLA